MASLPAKSLHKLRDILYQRKIPVQEFLRACDTNRDGAVTTRCFGYSCNPYG